MAEETKKEEIKEEDIVKEEARDADARGDSKGEKENHVGE